MPHGAAVDGQETLDELMGKSRATYWPVDMFVGDIGPVSSKSIKLVLRTVEGFATA